MIAAVLMSTVASAPLASEVTIYNQGFALVKEQRDLNLKEGLQEVLVEDVAQRIERESVGIKSLSSPGSFSVLEQNYRFDLINAQDILNRSVGQEITLTRFLGNGSQDVIRGTLMSAPTAIVDGPNGQSRTYNGLVLKAADGRIYLNPSGEITVTKMPEGMISRPSLVWLLNSAKTGANKIELSYITQGMSWTSNYVLSLEGSGKVGDFKGWVSLVNTSGASFKDAKLKLLAGEVFRAPQGGFGGRGGAPGAPMAALKMADSGMSEEQFAEYHLYTAQRPVTMAANEAKQVSLLEGSNVPVSKKLVVDATRGYGYWRPQEEGVVGSGPIKPLVLIEFKNDKASNLGMPLPAGTIKVFQRDNSGSLQMLGEARIDHTPKEEKLSLPVGRSFDIVAERKRTNFEWLGRRRPRDGTREEFEIEIRNRKETPETVHLIERSWGEWAIPKSNEKWEKLDSNAFQWVVALKPNEVRKITYTLETYWP